MVHYARVQIADGTSQRAICLELDLGEPTLAQFLKEAERGRGAFAAVRVVAAPAPVQAASAAVVRGPAGLVVEGLGVAEIAELVRRLSCSA